MEEAEDSSSMNPSTFEQISSEEVEDSSLMDHISTLILSKFLITKQEAKDSSLFMLLLSEFLISKQVVRGRRFLPIYSSASSSPSLVDPTFARPGIKHAGEVEKGRDSDRERG